MMIVGNQARQDKHGDGQDDEEDAKRTTSDDDLVAQHPRNHDQARDRIINNGRKKTGNADDAFDERARERHDSFTSSSPEQSKSCESEDRADRKCFPVFGRVAHAAHVAAGARRDDFREILRNRELDFDRKRSIKLTNEQAMRSQLRTASDTAFQVLLQSRGRSLAQFTVDVRGDRVYFANIFLDRVH